MPIHNQYPTRILTSPCHEAIPDRLSARGLFTFEHVINVFNLIGYSLLHIVYGFFVASSFG